MVVFFLFLLNLLGLRFKSKSRLPAENAVLRQRVIVLRRLQRRRIVLSDGDHLFFVQLFCWSITSLTWRLLAFRALRD
jgi:hypothetical protein